MGRARPRACEFGQSDGPVQRHLCCFGPAPHRLRSRVGLSIRSDSMRALDAPDDLRKQALSQLAFGQLQDEVPGMSDEASAGLEQPLLQACERPALDGERQDEPAQEITQVVGDNPKEETHLVGPEAVTGEAMKPTRGNSSPRRCSILAITRRGRPRKPPDTRSCDRGTGPWLGRPQERVSRDAACWRRTPTPWPRMWILWQTSRPEGNSRQMRRRLGFPLPTDRRAVPRRCRPNPQTSAAPSLSSSRARSTSICAAGSSG